MLVAAAVERRQFLAGKTPGFLKDRLDRRRVEITEQPVLDMAGEAGDVVEREQNV